MADRQWDESDSEAENVVIEENPTIRPRKRQTSVAHTLEKDKTLNSSVAGSQKDSDESDSDDSGSIGTSAASDHVLDNEDVITLDFDVAINMKKMIALYKCTYRNIITEFADVELFFISVDSLIIECLAHSYHDWTLVGQSIVLTKQIDRFLDQFSALGGHFKLIVFTDFATHFARDTTLSFARSLALAHLANGKYASDLSYFTSPCDTNWDKMLNDLTPSFLMISTDNVTREVCAQEDVNLEPLLELITLQALTKAVFVVPLTGIVVNFASVFAYLIAPRLTVTHNFDSYMAAHWECNAELLKMVKNPSIEAKDVKNVCELWTKIIVEANKGADKSDHWESLCCAVLLSTLVCTQRGPRRTYIEPKENGKRGLDVIRDRRLLLNTAVSYLDKLNIKTINFDIFDMWDGRLVLGLFDAICANEMVLPYRIQEEFAKLHSAAGLTKPLAVDTEEKLFTPIDEPSNPLSSLPFFYETRSAMLDKYCPELQTAAKLVKNVDESQVVDFAQKYHKAGLWNMRAIEEDVVRINKEEAQMPVDNVWQRKRHFKSKQLLSKWYEQFANALEGKNSNLLVDFSRVPKGFARSEEEEIAEANKKGGKGWAGQKPGGGGGGKKAGGKEPPKSKKDQIVEANRKAKDAKLAEGEDKKLRFAAQQGKLAVQALTKLYPTLELDKTKATCCYEITTREYREIMDNFGGRSNQTRRKVEAVQLVGHIKNCFVKHWKHLDDKQKEQIVDFWVSLGFDAPAGTKSSAEAQNKKLDLGMHMVYYQLEYGGQLIDIHSDPQKDDRVSGFSPDAWQRKMLDAVDRTNSALIVAPTSAGKTFVSYYCIEKVLRNSDDDIVVYVSPSKALLNQVCGSIYARFRNKTMQNGKNLFGTLTPEFGQNALTCQVLVTVPESLEALMLSTSREVQQFVKNIRYVIFDEVHSIGASEEAHIWEHLLLLIRCPFLALSATIGNANKLHEWLNAMEGAKSGGRRKVDLIVYSERYSELELALLAVDKPQSIDPVQAVEEMSLEEGTENGAEKEPDSALIVPMMPYGVFMPEKLRMFGIPADQQLTARQILFLYNIMASVDDVTKKQYEPAKFFGQKGKEAVWISRAMLRELENKLKERFLQWLENDEEKMRKVLQLMAEPIQTQLEYRALPFNKEKVARESIVSLVESLRDDNQLPAICFNDDRYVCEMLAETLFNHLEEKQKEFMESEEYKTKYEIKDEDKLLKMQKRNRDAAAKKKEVKKKKKGGDGEDGRKEKYDEREDDRDQGGDEVDLLTLQREKLNQVLMRFKLRGRGPMDSDLYDKMTERIAKQSKMKECSRLLLSFLERGIGFHHQGMSYVEKGAVEVLFRSGHLAIIFSTSTLALGVNMPCKTVIFGVDTPFLTPLLYRQMSGRAGRRGFDHAGTVIFMSIPTSKMRRLLTASLSNLHGNPPFTASFLLRLLSFAHSKQGDDIISPVARQNVARALLEKPFSQFTRVEAVDGGLQKQLKAYVMFTVQFLRELQLLDNRCCAKNLANLAMHISSGEPGNLLFVYLLQKGVLNMAIKSLENHHDKKMLILQILAAIFTKERLPLSFDPTDPTTYMQDAKSKLFMPPLPEDVQKGVDEYNSMVLKLYSTCMEAIAPHYSLTDARLCPSPSSSKVDVFSSTEWLVSPVFDGYSNDGVFLPFIPLPRKDHRGRAVQMNAFAIDFFVHESRDLLHNINHISINTMWFMLNDFNTILHRLADGLDAVTRTQDALALLVRELHVEYDAKFRAAFGMRTRD